MAGKLVITTNNKSDVETPAAGNIFEGLTFFVLQQVPIRSEIIRKILNNAGKIVKHESAADYIIADHARKNCPPGSISWTFIDTSFRSKALAKPDDHWAGPKQGTSRLVGSAAPGKSTRTPFAADDDRILWKWVEDAKQMGAQIKGNEIYKRLEEHNPRHTFQAWRDRYLRKLMDRPPPGSDVMVAANAPPTPPAVMNTNTAIETSQEPPRKEIPHNTPHAKDSSINGKMNGTCSGGGQDEETNIERTVDNAKKANEAPEYSFPPNFESAVKPDWHDQSRRKRRRDFENMRPRGFDSGPAGGDGELGFAIEMPKTAKQSRIEGPEIVHDWEPRHYALPGSESYKIENDYLTPRRNVIPERIGQITEDIDAPPDLWTAEMRGSHFSMFDDVSAAVKSPRTALTEANLASQQARERGQPIRGIDLPEDDQMQDQSSYAEYLRKMLPQGLLKDLNTPETQPRMMQLPRTIPTADISRCLDDTLDSKKVKILHSPTVYESSSRIRAKDSRLVKGLQSSHSSLSLDDQSQTAASSKSDVSNDESLAAQLETLDDVDLTIPSPEEDWDPQESPEEDRSRTNSKAGHLTLELEPKSSRYGNPTTTRESIIEMSSHVTSTTSDDETDQSYEEHYSVRHNGKQNHMLDTQDIVDAETQYPDLELPLPPDSDEDDGCSFSRSPTHRHQRPALSQREPEDSETEPEETSQDLSAWAQSMMLRGYTASAIISALKVCSARSDLAELVLFETRSGRGIPKEVPGIWSEEDDVTLESGNARGIKQLEEKHGWDECSLRLKHLAERRDEDGD